MNDTQKMLQTIINGQSVFRQEVVRKIGNLDKKLSDRIDGVDQKVDGLDGKIDGVEKRLTERLDKIGRQLAYLEDDAPTREEFEKVSKISAIGILIIGLFGFIVSLIMKMFV